MPLFISYSRQDSAFVDTLIRRLEADSFDVWVDRQGISGGAAWRKAIAEAIATCHAFLLVISPRSMESRYVAQEVSLADESQKAIFPIIHEPAPIPNALKLTLSGLQTIDFNAEPFAAAYARLAKGLRARTWEGWLPEPPAAPPLSPPPVAPPPLVLPGVWQVQIQHLGTGVIAQGRFTFYANGIFEGGIQSPVGAMQVRGQWQFSGGQLSLQGVQVNPYMPVYSMPYGFVLQIQGYDAQHFQGMTTAGEQVTCQRID